MLNPVLALIFWFILYFPFISFLSIDNITYKDKVLTILISNQ